MGKKKYNSYCSKCKSRETCGWSTYEIPDDDGCKHFILDDEVNKNQKCEFYNTCPSCSGWCNGKDYSRECVPFLQTAYIRLKENE